MLPRRGAALSAVVFLEEFGKLFPQIINIRSIADLDVGVIRVVERVILMIGFGIVEALQRRHLRQDGLLKNACSIELSDVSSAYLPLLIVSEENGGSVGSSNIGSLSIELSWIVDYREENLQEFSVCDLRGVIDDFDRLGMPGGLGCNLSVCRG